MFQLGFLLYLFGRQHSWWGDGLMDRLNENISEGPCHMSKANDMVLGYLDLK